MSARNRVQEAARRIEERQERFPGLDEVERLAFLEVEGLLVLDFYGHPFLESFELFKELLIDQEVANQLGSVSLRAPDVGANGVCEWDLSSITTSSVQFPALEAFVVELTAPGRHNMSFLGQQLDEAGQLAALLRKAPRLRVLTAPSAPSPDFLGVPSLLTSLSIDVGCDHNSFLLHLAGSTSLSELRCLEYGESLGRDCEPTPLGHLKELFSSDAFRSVRRLVLRNPSFTVAELAELKAHRRDLQFLVVRHSREYVD